MFRKFSNVTRIGEGRVGGETFLLWATLFSSLESRVHRASCISAKHFVRTRAPFFGVAPAVKTDVEVSANRETPLGNTLVRHSTARNPLANRNLHKYSHN